MEGIKFLLKLTINFIIIIFFYSCSVTGITNDYGKLKSVEKSHIHSFEKTKKLLNNEVYKINGEQLKKLLNENEKSLVVFFANGCKAKSCIPLNNYVYYANKNNLKLYLIMTGYENLHETLMQNVGSPLFSIENEYYNSTFRNCYINKFTKDLLGYEADFTKGLIYKFKKDSLVDVRKAL